MPIDKMESGGFMVTGKAGMEAYRFAHLITGLKSEMRGMRLTGKGSTCYSMLKNMYGFKGNKAKVLAQAEAYRDTTIMAQLRKEENE
tara:strand:+ start:169 stop:429 length:261 start_codon:yes stop_codon:yes gene_type:complete